MSLADAYDVDVQMYHRDGTLFVDTRTNSPEHLLLLLDNLGLDRHTGPGEVWHQVPEDMGEIAREEMADRAVAVLTAAGFQIDIDPGIIGGSAAHQAERTAATPPTPVLPLGSPARSPRTR